MVVYAQVKEYTSNIDAIWDNTAEIMRDTDGSPITGTVKSYYENGNTNYEFTYKNGKPDGITKRYRDNGIMFFELSYKDGKLEGFIKHYRENGTIMFEIPYVNGKKEGIMRDYYENGAMRLEVPHKDDLEEGIDKEYYEDGSLKHEINMKGGKIEGLAKYYYKNGRILEVQYKDGTAKSAFCVDNNGLRTPLAIIARDAEQSEATRGNLPDSNRGVLPPHFNPSLYEVCEQQF
jgi:antitoxin component YwqK of YwqJK toxin-antitoxin module